MAYYNQDLSREDDEALLHFLTELHLKGLKPSSVADEKRMRAEVSQRLRTNRIQAARGRLPLGETVFAASIEGERD